MALGDARRVEFTAQIAPGARQEARSLLDLEVNAIPGRVDEGVGRGLNGDGPLRVDQSLVDAVATGDPTVGARFDDSGAEWSGVGSGTATSPPSTGTDYQRMQSAATRVPLGKGHRALAVAHAEGCAQPRRQHL